MRYATQLAILGTVLSVTTVEARTVQLEHAPMHLPPAWQNPEVSTTILWGSIRVRAVDGEEVRARAGVTGEIDPGRAADQGALGSRIELLVERTARGLEVRLPADIPGFFGVDLELEVPRYVDLTLTVSRGGDIFVDGVAGRVAIDNRNGSVALDHLGSAAVVSARNGSIDAAFDAVDASAAMSFVTLNGSVELSLPRDFAADLHLRTHRGTVESEFPIVEDERSWPDEARDDARTRIIAGAIGGGGPRLTCTTGNGSVILRRAP